MGMFMQFLLAGKVWKKVRKNVVKNGEMDPLLNRTFHVSHTHGTNVHGVKVLGVI